MKNLIYLIILCLVNIPAMRSQNLSNCSGNTVTLLDDGNNFSFSRTATISFENDCGCNSTSNCQLVSVELPSNYSCQGLVVNVSPTIWHNDYFDVYYLPNCEYHGQDDTDPHQQYSNYLVSIDPIQSGGVFDMLICKGSDFPVNETTFEIDFTTSDLCWEEDCNSDQIPPSCTVSDITVSPINGENMVEVDFRNYVVDDCDDSPTVTGLNPTTSFEFDSKDEFPCDSQTPVEITVWDDAGNMSKCIINVHVECGSLGGCSAACDTEEVNLSTGINFNNGSVLPIGQYDGGWKLIDGPDLNLNYPLPTYIVNPHPSWASLLGTQYISPFANAANNESYALPYVLERKFCVCEPSEVQLDLSVLVDNFIEVGLYDGAGNLIQMLVSYDGPASTSTFLLPAFMSTTTHNLAAGTYSIRAGLRNDGNVTMGVAIQAKLKGGSLIESRCCTPFTTITGTIYNDHNCNGENNYNVDKGLSGLGVSLYDDNGVLVATSVSDTFGYYTFNDIDTGTYLVKQDFTLGQNQTSGIEGYYVQVTPNTVFGDLDFGNCPVSHQCPSECDTTSVDLSTGVDFNDGSLLPVGQYEGGWQLIDGPDTGLNYPLPGYVLQPHPSWGVLDGARYISPFENTTNNEMYDTPYLFERKFCVCQEGPIELEISALVDNFIEIGLYDESGNLIEPLLSYDGPSSTSTFLLPAFTSNTTHNLSIGTYSIRAGLRNDASTAMGMAIEATLRGGGLIESKCCSPFGIISGTVFSDPGCDGNNDFNTDNGISGVEIILCDTSGVEIDRITTDDLGYYSFHNIDAGSYLLKQTAIDGMIISSGFAGYEVNLEENTVEGGIDFGNCTPLNECPIECDTTSVDLSTGVDFNDGSLLPVGQYEGGWQLIDGPDTGLNYPLPGYVLQPHPSWGVLDGARYISPFENTSNNEMYDMSYLFERKFCVCQEGPIELEISALVDNFIEIGLYDESGNLIEPLLSYDGPSSTSTFLLPAFTSNTTHNLSIGTYSIRAGLRNDASTAMGMAIEATLRGGGLIESKCCSPFGIISGTVFNDASCNGVNNFGLDMGISGVEVTLHNPADNSIIASTTTDDFGYYTFTGLDPNDYIVRQTPITDLTQTMGSGGYGVVVSPNTVVGNIDFGNCSDACINDSTPPTILCNDDIQYSLDAAGSGTISLSDLLIEATDDCGEVTIDFSDIELDCNHVGPVHITLLAQDEAGNSATCEVTVEVIDATGACSTECCASGEELSTVVADIGVSSIVCDDNGNIGLELSGLHDCQFVSKVIWGDGESVGLDKGDDLPTHMYTVNGVFLISIEVSAFDAQDEICQVDYQDIPIFIKNCDDTSVEDPIADNRLQVYPIPARDMLNISLLSNSTGFSAKVYNVLGANIGTFSIPSGNQQYVYDTSALSSGTYYLVLSNDAGQMLETRFLIAK